VLAFSILWAMLGFLLSAWLFLGKKVGPASQILDRRQAEGKVVASSPSSPGARWDGFSSRAPGVRPMLDTLPRARDEWNHLTRLGQDLAAPIMGTEPALKKPEPTILDTTVDNGSEVPTSQPRRRGARAAPPKERPQPVPLQRSDPERLLYPIVSSRPE